MLIWLLWNNVIMSHNEAIKATNHLTVWNFKYTEHFVKVWLAEIVLSKMIKAIYVKVWWFVCTKLQMMLCHRQRLSKIDNKDVTMTASRIDKGIIWRVSDLVERRVPLLSIDVPPVISQHFQAIFQLSLLIIPTTTTKIDRGDGFVVSMCIIQWERSCQRKANVIILTITLLLSFPLVMMREKESQRSERWLKAIAE